MMLRGVGLVDTSVPSSDMRSQIVIVTGANTGIGLETARALAERGATVVSIALSQDHLRICLCTSTWGRRRIRS